MNAITTHSNPSDITVANDAASAETDCTQGWMHMSTGPALQQIDANQLASLNAMISYLAASSGQSEFRIERGLADRFNLPNVKVMPVTQFDKAIRYLVDAIRI